MSLGVGIASLLLLTVKKNQRASFQHRSQRHCHSYNLKETAAYTLAPIVPHGMQTIDWNAGSGNSKFPFQMKSSRRTGSQSQSKTWSAANSHSMTFLRNTNHPMRWHYRSPRFRPPAREATRLQEGYQAMFGPVLQRPPQLHKKELRLY